MQLYNKITWFEKAILKYILILIFAFGVGRFIFLGYNYDDIRTESFLDISKAFVNGLRMDISALSYFSPIVLLLLFLFYQFRKNSILIILKIILVLVFYLYFTIVIAELPIYDEWLTKLNSKAISYLANINEVWRTATWGQIFATFTIVPFLTFLFAFLTNKVINSKMQKTSPLWRDLVVLLFAILFGFIGARGGFYQIPLSASAVFYSNNRTLNFAAVNSFWNLGYGYYKESRYDEENKYKYFTDEKINLILKGFYSSSDSTVSILKTETPNIVLILFESWSADLVDSLDALYGQMPNWREIRKESLNFTKCYATGRHSEEGMLAVFAGFPSLSSSYLMGFTDKNAKLPTLTKKLSERNYQQSFFFGGDLGYANIKSFFFQNPFYKVKDEMDFPSIYQKGKLGYHDNALYTEMLKETKIAKEPFFIGGFTSSTHPPFDVPLKHFKKYTDQENDYMNSAYFADSCLGDFYHQSKSKAWFKNTLFIFVSDHSHPTPIKRSYCSPEDHRIVFMLAGGALKEEYKGRDFSKIISQIDIPKTILTQLNYSTNEFIFSRNILDSAYIPFAYFLDKTCQGTVNTDGFVRYSLTEDKVLFNGVQTKVDSITSISKALLQKSYSKFRSY